MALQKILFIDNKEDTCFLVKKLLTENGYNGEILRCSTSEEAIKKVQKENTDIILVEALEPDLFQSIFKLLQKRFANIPVIAITDTEQNATKAIEQGATDYILKAHIDLYALKKSIHYSLEHNKISSDYKRLFEESPTSMYIFDSTTYKFLAVNSAALSQYNYSKEEFLSMSAKDIRPEEELETFYRVASSVQDTYFDAGRWKHKNKEGKVFFVHIFSRTIEFEGRRAKIVLAINIDEQVKVEKVIEEKSRQVENILESITDGFYAINRDWEFTYVNQASEKILNHKREDSMGRKIWDLFPEAKKLKYYPEYQRAMKDNISVHFEEYYEPLDLWTLVNAYPTREGLAVYFVDITEQKKTQDKLYNDEQNLRGIINNTRDIIWSMDTNFKIISANEAFWERLANIAGKPISDLSEGDYDPEVFKTWHEYFIRAFGGESYKITWTEDYAGKVIYEEIGFNPIYDKNNNISGISCFSRDITEEQQYKNKIEKQNEQLREIAWIQSHKVRAPVASILGLVGIFNFKDLTDPGNAEVMTLIQQSAQNLDTVIREINNYTNTTDI